MPALLAAAPSPTRVGVAAVGPDPLAAGAAQAAFESALGTDPSITLVPAERLAASLCPGCRAQLPALDAALQAALAKQMEAAANAFYEASFDQALEALAAAEALTKGSRWVPVKDRVAIHLWRATVFQAQRNEGLAESEARAALALDPSLQVDLRIFRPSVKDLIDRTRPSITSSAVILAIGGVPQGAVIRVDDRPTAATSRVPRGVHWLDVAAPGFRSVRTSIRTDASARIAIPLALDLPGAAADAAARTVARGSATAADIEALAPLAPLADAFLLVQYRADGGYDAVLLHDGKVIAVDSDEPRDPRSLARAAAAALRAPPSAPRSGGLAALPGGISVSVRGGIAAPTRLHSLSGSGHRVDTAHVAFGPSVEVDVARGPWVASAGAAFLTYPGLLEVSGPGAGSGKAGGGTGVEARGAFAWRFTLGAFRAGPYAALGWERVSFDPVPLAGGGAIDVLGGHERYAPEVGGVAVAGAWGWSFDVRAGVVPFAMHREIPSGASGSSPSAGPGIEAAISAKRPLGRWTGIAGYGLSTRTTRYSGLGDASLDPHMRDAVESETLHRVSVGFGRSF